MIKPENNNCGLNETFHHFIILLQVIAVKLVLCDLPMEQ
jgi:hypothetical protein